MNVVKTNLSNMTPGPNIVLNFPALIEETKVTTIQHFKRVTTTFAIPTTTTITQGTRVIHRMRTTIVPKAPIRLSVQTNNPIAITIRDVATMTNILVLTITIGATLFRKELGRTRRTMAHSVFRQLGITGSKGVSFATNQDTPLQIVTRGNDYKEQRSIGT